MFGQAEVGAEFGLDAATFERVEVIRGPAASIYGDSAFFAVVNVITKRGAALGGHSVTLEAGTLGTLLTRAMTVQRFANGVDMILSATYAQSAGNPRLFFPVYDSPASNNGIAAGLDGEQLSQFFGQVTVKAFTVTGLYGRRERIVPTASFGSLFNEQESREQTTDRHLMADVEYARALGAARWTVRGAFDQFSYDGVYPLDLGTGDGAFSLGLNHVLGSRWTASTRLTRPLPGRQVLTLGAEFIDNIHQDDSVRFVDPPSELFSNVRASTQQAAFIQDEVRLTSWLIANGGLRYDRYEDFDRVTPRAALIAMPSSNQSFKYLYGRAFRAPNFFERNEFYFGARTQALYPESIDTHELVWERYTGDRLRTAVSALSLQRRRATYAGARSDDLLRHHLRQPGTRAGARSRRRRRCASAPGSRASSATRSSAPRTRTPAPGWSTRRRRWARSASVWRVPGRAPPCRRRFSR